MRGPLLLTALQWLTVAAICMVVCSSAAPTIVHAAGEVGAKIIEIEGAAEAAVPGIEPRALRQGDLIEIGEEITVRGGSTVTLALADNTMRRFTGPTTLTVSQDPSSSGGTVIANLTVAVTDMLFGTEPQTSEAVMATRHLEQPGEPGITVPMLIHPAPGERLLDLPGEFRWMSIQGVPLYRVSVYNSSELMWQGTISDTKATCPGRICDFRPGETYYWVVEALVGNTTLRSRAGDFAILDREKRSGLYTVLDEADASVSSAGMASILKARLCADAGIFSKAIEILDGRLQQSPDRSAYLLRAEIEGTMGLAESAAADYKRAMALPASD